MFIWEYDDGFKFIFVYGVEDVFDVRNVDFVLRRVFKLIFKFFCFDFVYVLFIICWIYVFNISVVIVL